MRQGQQSIRIVEAIGRDDAVWIGQGCSAASIVVRQGHRLSALGDGLQA